MAIYIGIFIVISILSVLEFLTGNKKVLFIVGLILSFFAGLRYDTGYDFRSYFNIYQGVNGFSDVFNSSIDAESGFLFLVYLFKALGLNYYTFLLFFAILSIGLLALFLYENFDYPSLIMVYYYVRFYHSRDMGQIRASMASIILLFSIRFLKEKRLIPFSFIVIIAAQFHITALVFFLAYFLFHYISEFNVKNSLIMLLFATFMGIVVQLDQLYLWAIPGRYLSYFTNPAYIGGKWLLNPILWMQLAIYFSIIIFTNIYKDKKFEVYHKIYFIASLVLIMFGGLATVSGRLSSPFATYEMILVPYFFTHFTNNKILNITFYYIEVTLFLLVMFVLNSNYFQFVPYLQLFLIP